MADLDEEESAIDIFFRWKMDKTQRDDIKDRIRDVYRVVISQMWIFDDLKRMEDSISSVYKIVREEGIPDGLVRGFKRDINMYKSEYKVSRNILRIA